MLTSRNVSIKKIINIPVNNKTINIQVNNKTINNVKKYNIQQMQNNKTIKHICKYI